MDSFDAADLRMRVRSAFSGPELRRLLESFGARPEEIDAGSTTNLAHHVVKLGSKLYGPRELIRRLANEKPLVEWPDLAVDDERWAGPMSLPLSQPMPSSPAGSSAEAPAGEALPTLVMDAPPAELGAPPRPAATLLDASIAQPVEDLGTPAPPAAEGSGLTPAPPSARTGALPYDPAFEPGASPPASFSPGSAFGPSPPPPKRTGLYVAIAGIAVGLVGVAFGVGMIVARPSAAPTEPGAAAAPIRTKSPAGRAATLVERGLGEIAALCEVEIEGEATTEVLELSLEACGRDEVEKIRRQREKDLLLARQDDRDRDPLPSRSTTQLPIVRQPGGPAPKAPPDRNPAQPKAGCRGQCSSSRAACQSDCGAEPTDAARYGAYQSCISRCVAEESRCRLGCR